MGRAEVAQLVACELAALPGVVAVAIGGSEAAGTADAASDLDLYVYSGVMPIEARREVVQRLGTGDGEVGIDLWEPTDEWTHAGSGVPVDVMYRTPEWIAEKLDRVLVRHEPSLGYTTCLWHNVRSSRALVDPKGWYGALQATADRAYPEPLRERIIATNYPVLRDMRSSYAIQLLRASTRHDRPNLIDRAAAFLASYFDVLFAANRVPHPGEKRQAAYAERACAQCPSDLGARIDSFALALSAPWGEQRDSLHSALAALVDGLDVVLQATRYR